jgi:hypothetical protein
VQPPDFFVLDGVFVQCPQGARGDEKTGRSGSQACAALRPGLEDLSPLGLKTKSGCPAHGLGRNVLSHSLRGWPDNSLSGSQCDRRHQNHLSPMRSDLTRSNSLMLLRSRDKRVVPATR